MLSLPFLALLFLAALLGGAQNAIAGGGSFLTFPALIAAGVGSKVANATSTVALWPGSVASTFGYRRDIRHERRLLLAFGAVSVVGGVAGALLLLWTPEVTFDRLVPFLLFGATLIFAFGPPLSRWLSLKHAHHGPVPPGKLAAYALIQFAVGVYGGYFGGGIGILMLAAFAAMGMEDLQAMNGLKAVLGSLINGVAIVAFGLAGIVDWPLALLMVAGSVLGGYGGAWLSRLAPPQDLRLLVISIGLLLSAAFFVKSFG
ncbi:MAG: sulfite exporter TauE/SafE family protein [Halobacteriales archaeon]|nr:sulfite exporter TauE/SafE family protein [Halobacteriales archaeon]